MYSSSASLGQSPSAVGDLGICPAALSSVCRHLDRSDWLAAIRGFTVRPEGIYRAYNIPDRVARGNLSFRTWDNQLQLLPVTRYAGGGWPWVDRLGTVRWLDFWRIATGRPDNPRVLPLVARLARQLSDDQNSQSAVRQLQRLNSMGKGLDISLTLVASYRQFTSNLFGGPGEQVDTASGGGLDQLGVEAPALVSHGYIPRDFTWDRVDVAVPQCGVPATVPGQYRARVRCYRMGGEKGQCACPAKIEKGDAVLAYGATLNYKRDQLLLATAGVPPIDARGLDLRARRVWTRAMISGPSNTRMIMRRVLTSELGTQVQKLEAVVANRRWQDFSYTDGHGLVHTPLEIKKGHISAAEAEVFDKLVIEPSRHLTRIWKAAAAAGLTVPAGTTPRARHPVR